MADSAAQNEQMAMKLAVDLEIEMMSDMFNRMTSSCHKKCISPAYRESELSKGESVCIDRCVGKYLDMHDKVGKKVSSIASQDEEAMKKLNEQNKS